MKGALLLSVTVFVTLLSLTEETPAWPSFDDDHRPFNLHAGKQRADDDNGVEKVISAFKTRRNVDSSHDGLIENVLLAKIERLFDEIIQEVVQAEQIQDEYRVSVQVANLLSRDVDKQLKSLLLIKMKQMYDLAMKGTIQHFIRQGVDKDKPKSEVEEIIERFLSKKISEIQSQEYERPLVDELTEDDANPENVQIMNNEYSYVPIYKFDGSSSDYCYPDWPSSENDYVCVNTLNPNAPVFFEVDTCDGLTVYTYWLWYGRQKTCIIDAIYGGHGNDWEDVSVHVNPNDGKVVKVVYHQHNGYYTRRHGTYEAKGERPVVYVGKIGHGSYHAHCDGQCSFTEFFTKGCAGSVNFCPGGCGYWDDFRNPGPSLRDVQLYPLMEGQVIKGIERPDREVCGIGTCEGSAFRSPFTSGCWQDNP